MDKAGEGYMNLVEFLKFQMPETGNDSTKNNKQQHKKF